MSKVNIDIISCEIIEDHLVKDTKNILFNFDVTSSGETVISGRSSITLNKHGIFPNKKDLKKKITNQQALKLILTAIKQKDWAQYK